ncbi:helix-turn-helix domain-containing protein [Elstera cyanobacteriorum]|uniref:helix-turn-helix domain-containing protein n=1 Tax=Elstera cyanobacteriorum TaxID=2022747 RepID=UPI0023557796|nr:helix-turn-helix transcriptional regulator [Elstera cyanobacteriorum]MCK6443109.1 helix-turn-helix domain-containing protein [Elstera cyanobacteriorum]
MPHETTIPSRRRGRPPRTDTLGPVDDHIGARIRLYRRSRGISQKGLGQGMGLTFQQIQKYENGRSRVTVSALCRIADILDVPVILFFSDLPDADPCRPAPNPLSDRDTLQVLQHFLPLPGPVKKQMLALMRVLRPAEGIRQNSVPAEE